MGKFSDSVNPSSFKILNQPDYIFLCGGKLEDFDRSLRAHFYRDRVLPNPDLLKRVQLAEKADEWYQTRRVFADLLELEEHLAGLSACILLFVESPGAIAEFGAFSQMELLRDKLVVVMEDSHFGQTSFIRNGLVEHANRTNPGSVLSYPWLSAGPLGGIDPIGAADTCDGVEKEVRRILRSKPKTTSFRTEDHGHLMLLITDLISLNFVMLQQELQQVCTDLGLQIEPSELKKYLFLLDRLSLISTFHYGNVDYYINVSGTEHVDYAPKAPSDRSRLRNDLRADYPFSGQKTRALQAFQRRPSGGAL